MQLKIKLLKWSAGLPVAMLNEKTAGKIGCRASLVLNSLFAQSTRKKIAKNAKKGIARNIWLSRMDGTVKIGKNSGKPPIWLLAAFKANKTA